MHGAVLASFMHVTHDGSVSEKEKIEKKEENQAKANLYGGMHFMASIWRIDFCLSHWVVRTCYTGMWVNASLPSAVKEHLCVSS